MDWISGNYIELFGAITGIIYVFLEIRQNLWLWPVGIITSAVYILVFFTGKLYADMGLQGYYLIISVIGWYWWVRGSGLRAQGAGGEKEKGRGGEREILGVDSPFEEPVAPQHGGQENHLTDSPFEEPVLSRAKEGQEYRLTDSPFEGGQGDVFLKSNNLLLVSNIKIKTGIILLLIFVLLYAGMWLLLDNFTDSPVPGWDSFITSLSIIATWMLARKIIEHWYLWMLVNAVAMVLFLSRGLYPTAILYSVYFIMSFIGLKEWRKTLPHRPVGS